MTLKSIFYLNLFVLLFAYSVMCDESLYNLKCLHATGDCTVLDDYLDDENIDKVIYYIPFESDIFYSIMVKNI
jgi:hypothetical protein